MSAINDRPLIVNAIKSGCDDFILKPFKFNELMDKVAKLVNFYEDKKRRVENTKVVFQREDFEAEVIIYSRQIIEKVFKDAFEGKEIEYPAVEKVVGKMVEILNVEENLPMAFKMKSYNDYTYIHSVNVASLAMSFLFHLGWDEKDLQLLGEGAFLHDIGKTGVDLGILMKPEKLTDEEFGIVKKHPEFGVDILTERNVPAEVRQIVIEHHERVDGTGYPQRLKGDQINKFGKICGIIDVYDALTTDRCYHQGLDSKDAIKIMKNNKSGALDVELFNQFEKLVNSDVIGK